MSGWVPEHQKTPIIRDLNQEIGRYGNLQEQAGDEAQVPLPLPLDSIRSISPAFDLAEHAGNKCINFAAVRRTGDELILGPGSLRLLLEMTDQIVSNHDLCTLLRTASTTLRNIMQCNTVAVHMPDPEGGSLRLFAMDSFDGMRKENSGGACLVERNCCEEVFEVFRCRKPLFSAETNSCTVPLISRNHVLGVLELVLFENQSFGRVDLDFVTHLAGQMAIAVENARVHREIEELRHKLGKDKLCVEDEIRSERGFEEIVGRSPAIRSMLRRIEIVAPTESTVLICGETGTGKDLVAHAIHKRSGRNSNAFVKLNCAAIPTGLLESELFGHEKGAFTGAIMQRVGRFELADRGTVFLDEIGEIPLELQPKLLRVLQEREFERLGSTRTIKTNARLISATNRNLAACVKDQTFREDLFYRLNVFPIHVPPLRERAEDIPLLVRHFVQHFARRIGRVIDTIPARLWKR